MEKLKRFKKPLVVLSLALVLAFVWMTGASTYAKYITEKTVPTQSATVAKWGFIVSANADNLFGANYYNHKTDNNPAALATVFEEENDNTGTLCVSASSKTVAPGTTGSMTFTIGGSAEVLSKLTVSMTNVKDISLTKGDSTYNPIKWTLNDGTSNIVTDVTLADAVKAIIENTTGDESATLSEDGEITASTVINLGTELTSKTYTLSWKWDFYVDDNTDIQDTILGVAAKLDTSKTGKIVFNNLDDYKNDAMYKDYTANTIISFGLTIKIEQIQKAA